MSTIETFRPVAACSDSDLQDGVNQGLWLARALFVAIGQIDNRDGESVSLAFLGECIVAAVEEKHKELADRTCAKAGGAA